MQWFWQVICTSLATRQWACGLIVRDGYLLVTHCWYELFHRRPVGHNIPISDRGRHRMAVTQSQLAMNIKEAISSPLLELFGGLLRASPIQLKTMALPVF